MNRFQAFVVELVVCSAVCLTVQVEAEELPGAVSTQAAGWSVVERGPDYRVLQKTTIEGGTNRVRRVTELATGMAYTNNAGQLVESKEEITLLETGGAAATQGRTKVYFPSDIYNGAIEVVASDGRHLRSRPLGVSYDDGTNSVWIALLQHSTGVLVGSNKVVYRDAFKGLADFVVTYRRSGIECELVMRQSPPSPKAYNLDPDASTLQLITEFFDTADPEQIPTLEDPAYGITDDTLRFGSLSMVRGKAFVLGQGSAKSVAVYKGWFHWEGRSFLMEQVPLKYLAADLLTLPKSTNILTAQLAGDMPLRSASAKRALPPPRGILPDTNPIRIASLKLDEQPGVVLDFVTVDSSSYYVNFESGQTYFVSGPCWLWGGSFNGGIIKFARGASLNLGAYDWGWPYPYAGLDMWPFTSSGTRTIFTAVDDDSVGEAISTGLLSGYYADPAVSIGNQYSYDYTHSAGAHSLDIRYANTGVELQTPQSEGNGTFVENCSFSYCGTAVHVGSGVWGDVTVDAVKICSVENEYVDDAGVNVWFYNILYNCGDIDGDGIEDGWMLHYFGHAAGLPYDHTRAQDDYDGDGISNYDEFVAGTDPNTIAFWITVTNQYVRTNIVPVRLDIIGGVPVSKAILVDSTNFTGATWTSYTSSNLTVDLTTNQGWHQVWVGLRGGPTDSQQTWHRTDFKLDSVPPVLVVTNPIANSTVSRPIIQLQGHALEALDNVYFDITNPAGVWTNRQGFVTHQYFDTNSFEFTTNCFQCFDIRLTNGANTITVRAEDLAGNVTTTNVTVTLDYSDDTNAPVIRLVWPQDGMKISGTNFYVRGILDDETAAVTAQIVDTNGQTNIVDGLVERGGMFWVEGIPLADGSNFVTITATDAAGNVSVTNIVMTKSDVVLTIESVPNDESLYRAKVTVAGNVSDTDCSVKVNGVDAEGEQYGQWTAYNVPVVGLGTATFDAAATAAGGEVVANVSLEVPMPPAVVIVEHQATKTTVHHAPTGDWTLANTKTYNMQFQQGEDGQWQQSYTGRLIEDNSETILTRDEYVWSDTDPVGTHYVSNYLSQSSESMSALLGFVYEQVTSVPDKDLSDVVVMGEYTYYYWAQHYFGRDVRHHWIDDQASDADMTLNSRTLAKFFPGDKAILEEAPLGLINAGAIEDGEPPQAPWQYTPGRDVPFSSTRVAGKTVNEYGFAAVALASGAPIDAVVTAPVQHYGGGASGTKHELITLCHASIPVKRTRRTIGVGEEVWLGFIPDLPVQYITVYWSTSAGAVEPTTGTETTLTAPSNAAPATVNVHIGGAKLEREFQVKEPKGMHHADTVEQYHYEPGIVAAGMKLRVFVEPLDVSFYRVQIMEVPGLGTNGQGYYATHPIPPHGTNELAGNWFYINEDNSWYDRAEGWGTVFPPPGDEGSFEWDIPGVWKVGEGEVNEFADHWTQYFFIDAFATARVLKFLNCVRRTVLDYVTPCD